MISNDSCAPNRSLTRFLTTSKGATMWNEPTKGRLSEIPRLYETEHVPLKEKIVHLHFFIAGCDWYITEFDGSDIFFGYAILNQDYQMAEWGYISFTELKSINIGGIEIDCELEIWWKNPPAGQVKNICKGMGWSIPTSKPELHKGEYYEHETNRRAAKTSLLRRHPGN